MKPPFTHLLVLAGALLGGILGHLATAWLYHHYGYYAMILPGALVGLGTTLSRSRLLPLHILCALLGLAAGILTEWRLRPFNANHSLPFFLAHLHQLDLVTLLMLAAGTFIAFYLPFHRSRELKPS